MDTLFENFEINNSLNIDEIELKKFIDKANKGGEIDNEFPLSEWYEKRFLPNCILIDEVDYTKMCIDALKILETTAGTDYGTSRQRDLGQLWADMTRGYLGELAFIKFLKEKFNVIAELGHEKGSLIEFLDSDVKYVRDMVNNTLRKPKIQVSVKTVKSNGIWLDIPGDQFNHSDIHVMVKVGAGRDHLFSFFKAISVFKDKVLKRGVDIGWLTIDQSNEIFERIPSFSKISAYVCGFVLKDETYKPLSYTGKKGRKNYEINSWCGFYDVGDIQEIRKMENLSDKAKINFSGIGEFSSTKRYLFNAGKLKWALEDWKKVIDKL